MDVPALTCKELVELVTEYFENALSEQERRRFESHLAGCEGCQKYLDQMRRTIKLAGSLSEEALAPPARAALLEAFRHWKVSGG